jgi:hypothetical protein
MGLQLFPLGRLVATPGVLEALERVGETPTKYLVRHMTLDPGELDAHDQLANRRAMQEGGRILSAYLLDDGTRIWIITEADRSLTTLLLPEEY